MTGINNNKSFAKRIALITAVVAFLIAGMILIAAEAYADGTAEIVSPKKGARFSIGKEIKLKARLNSYSMNPNAMMDYIIIEVVHNGEQKYLAWIPTFDSDVKDLGEFTPEEAGTYTIKVDGYTTNTFTAYYAGPSTLDSPDQSYDIKVVASAKTIKSVKPDASVDRTGKKTAEISVYNASGDKTYIYRSMKKKGKYKLIKKTTKDTFTDKKLKAGKVYYYKVRFMAKQGKKTYYSKYSKVLKAAKYKPGRIPVLTLKNLGGQKVKITWKCTANVDRYYVLRASEPGQNGGSLLADLPRSKKSYVDTEYLEAGQTYYYFVLGIKNPDSDHPTKYFSKEYSIKVK